MKLKRTLVLSLLSLATASCWVAAAPGPGAAALQVSLRITETCAVTAGTGASALSSAAADATAAGSGIRAQCSRKIPYSITLRSSTDAAKPEVGGAAALPQGAPGASASSVDHAETVTVSVDY